MTKDDLAAALHRERIGCEDHRGQPSADEVASVHREQARRLADSDPSAVGSAVADPATAPD